MNSPTKAFRDELHDLFERHEIVAAAVVLSESATKPLERPPAPDKVRVSIDAVGHPAICHAIRALVADPTKFLAAIQAYQRLTRGVA